MSNAKPLREFMPETAAWIDQLRDAFGADVIVPIVRAGMNGEPVFYAIENGRTVGTKAEQSGTPWNGDGIAARRFCDGCHGECVGTTARCSARADKGMRNTTGLF